MTQYKENLLLPAPIEDLIRNGLDQNVPHTRRETYRSRMVAVKEALEKAIEIFDKQKS